MDTISTDNAPAAIGPYSQAIRANGLLFASGQIPVDPATGKIPEGIAAQAEQSCRNCGALLAAAGLDFSKVIKTTCFLADIADFAAFNEVYAKYFTSKPARSCVVVPPPTPKRSPSAGKTKPPPLPPPTLRIDPAQGPIPNKSLCISETLKGLLRNP